MYLKTFLRQYNSAHGAAEEEAGTAVVTVQNEGRGFRTPPVIEVQKACYPQSRHYYPKESSAQKAASQEGETCEVGPFKRLEAAG